MNGKNLFLNEKNEWQSKNYVVKIVHLDADPPNVNRILVSGENIRMELQPSKGLSVGETFFNNQPVFWEPPIGMPDPETLDLWSDEVAINGKPAPGFTFLKTFTGGIELYGLKNWGMPVEKQGKLQVLHGETPGSLAQKSGNRELSYILTKKEMPGKEQAAESNIQENTANLKYGPELLKAAWEGDIEKVKELLAKGADLKYLDNDGFSAIQRAKDNGHEEIVKLLEEAD